MNKIIRLLPALGLRGLKNADLIGYTENRITDLLKNIDSFPELKPTPLDLNDIKEEYKKALSSRARNAALKKNLRRSLEIKLTQCAIKCAQIAAGNLSIYMLSGFDYKRKRGIDYALLPIKNLTVELGSEEGSFIVKFKTVKNAKCYLVEYGLRDAPNDSWISGISASCGKVLIEDLESGIYYKIRVRGLFGNSRPSPWSNTMIKKAY